MAVGDVYELVLEYTALGQEMLNRFYYIQNLSTTDLDDLIDLFESQVLNTIQDITSSASNYLKIRVRDVLTGGEEAEKVLSGITGNRSALAMPPFVTFSYELVNEVAGRRNGRKAFGVISEADTADGIPDATFLPTLQATATALAAPLGLLGVENWKPVLYRSSLLGASVAFVTDAAFKRVSTQNSRKFYNSP